MHKIGVITVMLAMINLSACAQVNNTQTNSKDNPKAIAVGASKLDAYLPQLQGKRVAMMVNQTSTIGASHVVDTLLQWGVNIVKIFAPEHGFRGDHADGAHIANGTDPKTGLPIVSLYGKNRKPSDEMLSDIDVIVFDIQDVGVRYYTFISSMHYLMEACATNGKEMMVLDRPNPSGHYVDGPVLAIENRSFIGMHPVPLVHGMTVAEFALMINGERWLNDGDTCLLTVIPCDNYAHDSMYQLPIRPSPNLPNMQSVYLYPSLGLFEQTNVSVGRGTDKPFQVLGRPGVHPKLVYQFTPRSIPGVSDYPKHENQLCYGVDLSNTAVDRINLEYLKFFYSINNESTNGPYFKSGFKKLAGSDDLQQQIESGMTVEDIYKSWQPGLDAFKKIRVKYLLY